MGRTSPKGGEVASPRGCRKDSLSISLKNTTII